MRLRGRIAAALVAFSGVELAVGHNGVTVAHSPPGDGPGPCPSDAPLQMFLLPDPILGGPIAPGASTAEAPGAASMLTRIATNALLARPEFGGYVYVGSDPGMHFVDPQTPCHAMTTAYTGGAPFSVSLERTWWPAFAHVGLTDSFGAPLLLADGDAYVFGSEAGAHFHPLWLTRRAGQYDLGLRITSTFFSPTDEFSLRFVSATACVDAVPLDLSSVFNADVVDSDETDAPLAFDGNGHYWLLAGLHGAGDGLPVSGRLDVFQLGGPAGAGLLGDAANCLFDDGVRSSVATIDLSAQSLAGPYESLELLIGASGVFSSSDRLTLTLGYASGTAQTVQVRRAAAQPRFFPLLDWHVPASPPTLSVGPSGDAVGGGFVRSNGVGVDTTVAPVNSFYLQRVTFPVDATRELRTISVADYVGAGRVGLFAITAMRGREVCVTPGDANCDGGIDFFDIDPFLLALFDPAAYASAWPQCDIASADVNRDAGVDFFDIDPFIAALFGL